MSYNQYPIETFLEIEGWPYHQGRIQVYQVSQGFYANIDVVFKEGQKIFLHVGRIEDPSHEEILELAVFKLGQFLKNGGKKN